VASADERLSTLSSHEAETTAQAFCVTPWRDRTVSALSKHLLLSSATSRMPRSGDKPSIACFVKACVKADSRCRFMLAKL
jgi:hypothetical protein